MEKIFIIFILYSITLGKNLIKYEEIEKISIIKFNNPTQLNKLDIELLKEFDNTINSIDTQKNDVLIITGEGNESFTVGGRPSE